jgi:hypothetical protein
MPWQVCIVPSSLLTAGGLGEIRHCISSRVLLLWICTRFETKAAMREIETFRWIADQVLREMCGRDSGDTLAGELDLADVVCRGGLVRRLLDLLRALPPIQTRRPSMPMGTETRASAAGGSAALGEDSGVQPVNKVLYFGYRTDLVAGKEQTQEQAVQYLIEILTRS